jgi:hypothetical protein
VEEMEKKEKVKTKKKLVALTDAGNQERFFKWIDDTIDKIRRAWGSEHITTLEWVHAIPDSYYTDETRAKSKRKGVKQGVANVFLPGLERGLPRDSERQPFRGLYIKFKRGNRDLTPIEQEFKDYILSINLMGYVVVRDWKEAAEMVVNYLDLKTYAPISDEKPKKKENKKEKTVSQKLNEIIAADYGLYVNRPTEPQLVWDVDWIDSSANRPIRPVRTTRIFRSNNYNFRASDSV